MSTYFVTGGAGFLGSHLSDALVAAGHDLIVLDNFSTGRSSNLEGLQGVNGVRVVRGSAADEDLVDELMRDADVCVHLASAVGVRLIVDRPLEALLGMTHGVDTVMAAAVRHGRRMLYASTSEVYGRNTGGLLDEESDLVIGSPFKSRWSYALAKAWGESLAHGYHRDSGAEIMVVRLFNAVGARQSGTYGMVLPRLVRQALNGQPLTVYGDGSQTRCFTHVLDTVDAIMRLCEEDAAVGRVFNVGNPVPVSIAALAARIAARTDSPSRIKLVPYDVAYPTGFQELGARRPDTTRLRELTGWEARRPLDEAIDDVIAFERSQLGERIEAITADVR